MDGYRKTGLSAVIEAPLGIVPGCLARRVKPDAVRSPRPVPLARGSRVPAMITSMIGLAIPVRFAGEPWVRIRHTVTRSAIIEFLAFSNRHTWLSCDGWKTCRSARVIDVVTV